MTTTLQLADTKTTTTGVVIATYRAAEPRAPATRLPGYTISAEIIFGMPDQMLTIRHDSGSSAQPYVDGALLAIRKVSSFVGLRRGLDSVLDLG